MTDRHSARFFARFHLLMMAVWAGLLVPTLLWWKESILWVAAMIVGHWAGYDAARAELSQEDDE